LLVDVMMAPTNKPTPPKKPRSVGIDMADLS
jgi:hypothetical protein